MAREAGPQGQGRVAAFRATDLKICELCGWLNLASNEECFVCGWRGRFERDPDAIHAAAELAIRRNGRLELQHLTDPRVYRQPAPPTWRARIYAAFARYWQRLRRAFRR